MSAHQKTVTVLTLVLSLGMVACGSAEAMARKSMVLGGGMAGGHSSTDPHAATVVGGGQDYRQGYELGHRNGTLISQRLSAATIGQEGCSGLDGYERALLKVARTVKPPRHQGLGKEISKGFFRGYLDAVRDSLQDIRKGCHAVIFQQGTFAGEFYGSLLCSAAESSLDVYEELESAPLYSGWSGGALGVQDECIHGAKQVLSECGTSLLDLQSITDLHLNVSCSD